MVNVPREGDFQVLKRRFFVNALDSDQHFTPNLKLQWSPHAELLQVALSVVRSVVRLRPIFVPNAGELGRVPQRILVKFSYLIYLRFLLEQETYILHLRGGAKNTWVEG